MSRKICRRRHYALMNPIGLAISGATITPESDLDKLRMRELSAIESFAKGVATPSEFRDLCDMLNLCETMAGMGIGPEALETCSRLQLLLLVSKDDFETDGVMRFSPKALQWARDLYAFHDLQRTSVDRSTYERAIAATRNRIRSAHPGVKVLT